MHRENDMQSEITKGLKSQERYASRIFQNFISGQGKSVEGAELLRELEPMLAY
jgi:hypothetical protein